MANITTTAVLGDLAQVGAIARFTDVFNQAGQAFVGMEELKKIFKVESTSDSDIRDVAIPVLGLMAETSEGDAYNEDSVLVGYETDYHVKKLTKSVEVTEEALRYKQYKDKLDEMRMNAEEANRTMVKYGMNILNAGFSSGATVNGFTVYRMADAKNLFSISHPRKDGGTAQSNASSTGIVLNETNLETGRLAIEKQLTDRGLPLQAMRPVLVVPTDLAKTATILVNSEFRPSTANNDINFYNGVIMDVLVSKWLNATGSNGSTTAWFLIDPMLARLKMYIGWNPDLNNSVEAKTRNTVFTVSVGLAAGHSDYRGTWGSKGDGLSYSS